MKHDLADRQGTRAGRALIVRGLAQICADQLPVETDGQACDTVERYFAPRPCAPRPSTVEARHRSPSIVEEAAPRSMASVPSSTLPTKKSGSAPDSGLEHDIQQILKGRVGRHHGGTARRDPHRKHAECDAGRSLDDRGMIAPHVRPAWVARACGLLEGTVSSSGSKSATTALVVPMPPVTSSESSPPATASTTIAVTLSRPPRSTACITRVVAVCWVLATESEAGANFVGEPGQPVGADQQPFACDDGQQPVLGLTVGGLPRPE